MTSEPTLHGMKRRVERSTNDRREPGAQKQSQFATFLNRARWRNVIDAVRALSRNRKAESYDEGSTAACPYLRLVPRMAASSTNVHNDSAYFPSTEKARRTLPATPFVSPAST